MTLVTEKEAAEKWCPMFRAAIAVGPSDGVEVMTNRDGMQTLTSLHNCIGSRCMAWRWGEPPRSGTEFRRVYVDYSNTATTQERDFTTEGKGYCGAFGKVEP